MFRNVWKIVVCCRRNTSAAFSQKTRCRFLAGAALWRPPSSFCVASAALDVSHCVLYTPHSTLHNSTLYNHSTMYTPHSTVYTPLFTLCTSPSTVCTRAPLHTARSTVYNVLQQGKNSQDGCNNLFRKSVLRDVHSDSWVGPGYFFQLKIHYLRNL